jgi:hypothetical protein
MKMKSNTGIAHPKKPFIKVRGFSFVKTRRDQLPFAVPVATRVSLLKNKSSRDFFIRSPSFYYQNFFNVP